MQAGDLIAAQDKNLLVGDNQSQRMMQAGGKSLPADVFELLVEACDVPDITLHRADHRRSVGKEIVTAEKHERVPGIVDWRRDGIDHIGPCAPQSAARFEDLRPLCRPTARQIAQRMFVGRHQGACEVTIFDSGGVKIRFAINFVGEQDLHPMSIVTAVPACSRLRFTACDTYCSALDCHRVDESVSHGREFNKTSLPNSFVAEGVGIKASRKFAALAQLGADATGYQLRSVFQNAAHHRAAVHLVPAVITPRVFILISPMTQLSAVEPRIGRQNGDWLA